MKLKKYVNEIVDIAICNNESWNNGKDMFLANIRNYGVEGAPYYVGADGVDYGAIKAEWETLSAEEQRDARNEFDAWYRKNLEIIIAARRAGMLVIAE